MNFSLQNFSFKFARLPFISRNPQRSLPTAMIVSGEAGLTVGIMSLSIKSQLKQKASAVIALHPDSNILRQFKKQAKKYLPKHKIFCVKTSSDGNGNGKDPSNCVEDFQSWNGDLHEEIPKFIKESNAQGTTTLEAISGTGGSFPAWLQAIHSTQKYFKYHFQMVTEPTDKRSAVNLPSLVGCLANDFDASKNRLIFARNGTRNAEIDFANATILNAMTLGNNVYDTSDNFGDGGILPRASSLNVKFQNIPERFDLFGRVQDLDRVRATTRTLLRELQINPSADVAIVAGKVAPYIVKQVGAGLYDFWGEDIQVKIGKLKIGEWNCVGGRLRKLEIPNVSSSAIDRLRSKWKMEKEDE
jgi:hypothetical protein